MSDLGAGFKCLILLAVISSVWSFRVSNERQVSYEGYQVLRLTSDDHVQLQTTLRTMQKRWNLDVWSRRRQSVDVIVAPEDIQNVRETLAHNGVSSEVLIYDLQSYLEKSFAQRNQGRTKRAVLDVTSHFLSYPQMMQWLQGIPARAQWASVTLGSLGKSYFGQDVPVVELREKNPTRKDKYAILIDAGIHAREWIAPSMALAIINKLAFNPENDPDVPKLLEKFDWYVAPILNPDGYVYSQSSPAARLWRKTRTNKHSSWCPGVDGNRNFGYDWKPAVGGSTYVCSEVYAGPSPFSEPETVNVRNWMIKHQQRGLAYISTHSYGEKLLYPYGSSQYKVLPDKDLIVDVARAFQSALATTGHDYEVGNSAEALYPAAGGSDDYAKGAVGIKVSYTLELTPGSGQHLKFDLPENMIKGVVDDTWLGFKAMAERLFTKFGYPGDDPSLIVGRAKSDTVTVVFMLSWINQTATFDRNSANFKRIENLLTYNKQSGIYTISLS